MTVKKPMSGIHNRENGTLRHTRKVGADPSTMVESRSGSLVSQMSRSQSRIEVDGVAKDDTNRFKTISEELELPEVFGDESVVEFELESEQLDKWAPRQVRVGRDKIAQSLWPGSSSAWSYDFAPNYGERRWLTGLTVVIKHVISMKPEYPDGPFFLMDVRIDGEQTQEGITNFNTCLEDVFLVNEVFFKTNFDTPIPVPEHYRVHFNFSLPIHSRIGTNESVEAEFHIRHINIPVPAPNLRQIKMSSI